MLYILLTRLITPRVAPTDGECNSFLVTIDINVNIRNAIRLIMDTPMNIFAIPVMIIDVTQAYTRHAEDTHTLLSTGQLSRGGNFQCNYKSAMVAALTLRRHGHGRRLMVVVCDK